MTEAGFAYSGVALVSLKKLRGIRLHGATLTVYKDALKLDTMLQFDLLGHKAVPFTPAGASGDEHRQIDGVKVAELSFFVLVRESVAEPTDADVLHSFGCRSEAEREAWLVNIASAIENAHRHSSDETPTADLRDAMLQSHAFMAVASNDPAVGFRIPSREKRAGSNRKISVRVTGIVVPNDNVHRPTNHYAIVVDECSLAGIVETTATGHFENDKTESGTSTAVHEGSIYRTVDDFEFFRTAVLEDCPHVTIPGLTSPPEKKERVAVVVESFNLLDVSYFCKYLEDMLNELGLRDEVTELPVFQSFFSTDRRTWDVLKADIKQQIKRKPKGVRVPLVDDPPYSTMKEPFAFNGEEVMPAPIPGWLYVLHDTVALLTPCLEKFMKSARNQVLSWQHMSELCVDIAKGTGLVELGQSAKVIQNDALVEKMEKELCVCEAEISKAYQTYAEKQLTNVLLRAEKLYHIVHDGLLKAVLPHTFGLFQVWNLRFDAMRSSLLKLNPTIGANSIEVKEAGMTPKQKAALEALVAERASINDLTDSMMVHLEKVKVDVETLVFPLVKELLCDTVDNAGREALQCYNALLEAENA